MRPKWDNLFWYERGESHSKPQLENNTTKGFLKVLQETDRSVSKAFLNQIFTDPIDVEEASIEYDTQVTLDEIPQTDRTLHLLGLSYDGKNLAKEANPRTGDGRVDGLVTVDGGEGTVTIVVEVKTGRDTLQEGQLGTYRGTLDINQENCHGLSWLIVWELFDALGTGTDREPDRLLLTEFADYLELMDMVPFRGFDRAELQKPTSTEYKRSLMRGINQRSSGAFAEALYEACARYGFDDFVAISNQDSTQLHLVEERYHEAERSTFNVNHYTAGFWNDRLNLQINIRNRIVGTITERGSTEVADSFADTLVDVLETVGSTTVTNEANPLLFVRHHGNIPQEHDNIYQPSTFYLEQFTFAPGTTDEYGLRERIDLLARVVREYEEADLVSSPAFVIEKQLPYTSSFIDDELLPEYTLEFFEALRPVYKLFAEEE